MYVKKICYKIKLDPCSVHHAGGFIDAIFKILVDIYLVDGREYKNIKVKWNPFPIVDQTDEEDFTVEELDEIENMLGGLDESYKEGIWSPITKLSKEVEKLGIIGCLLRIEGEDIIAVNLDQRITKD